MIRCVNIDWLECFCLEDAIGYPHNADFFRERGWEVRERDYGTPMYNEMFTLIDAFGEPFCEVRRSPKSDTMLHGLFNHYACHVRLVNRSCYANNAAQLMIDFLAQNGFTFQRISRIDLCYDFERFDFGDDPAVFLERFIKGRYSKINQAEISARGLDEWDGRRWNSVRWGSPKSMVTTRFYNKTMELRTKHDKPYIRQAWQSAKLVDDWQTLEKHRRDGTVYKPEIWRVEFAIKSGTKKWFVVDDYNGDRRRKRSLHNTLDVYDSKDKLWDVFLSLTHFYFHFKHVEYKARSKAATGMALAAIIKDDLNPLVKSSSSATRELQRKDRCADKELFKKNHLDTFYKFEKQLSSKPQNNELQRLLQRLYDYRSRQYDEKVRSACDVIIQKLENETRVLQLSLPYSATEIEILRKAIALRLKEKGISVTEAREQAENIYKIEREIWTNTY